MSEQNRYRIDIYYKSRETEEWTGWRDNGWLAAADTWQDAIRNMLLDEGGWKWVHIRWYQKTHRETAGQVS